MLAFIRVLLADDHRGVQAELRAQLGGVFEIIGVVEDGRRAVDAVFRLDPDVVILDISMPFMNGFQVARHLRDAKCRSKIVILTTYEDEDYIDAAFSSGANGFVCKSNLTTDLAPAIREVLQGRVFISPALRRSRHNTRTTRS
jgi:DNA-binding NarL/FixJ family response regulator